MTHTALDHAPVIVAVDDSDDSLEAAAWAAEHAAAWAAPLHMITTASARPGVARVAAWRAGHDPDTTEAVTGDLVRAVTDRARHARLIVLPATLSDAALADRVHCPVVVCRDGQPPTVVPTTRAVGGATAIGAGRPR